MEELGKRIGKFVLLLVAADLLLFGLAYAIAYFSKIALSEVLFYAGLLCIIIGGLSMVGNRDNSTDASYFMAKSVGAKSTNEFNEESFDKRSSRWRFLIFMASVGGVLIAIVVLSDVLLK